MTITATWEALTEEECERVENNLEIGESIGDAEKPLYKILSKKIKKKYNTELVMDEMTGKLTRHDIGTFDITAEMEVEPI